MRRRAIVARKILEIKKQEQEKSEQDCRHQLEKISVISTKRRGRPPKKQDKPKIGTAKGHILDDDISGIKKSD